MKAARTGLRRFGSAAAAVASCLAMQSADVGYAQMAPRLDAGIVGGLRLRIATLNAVTNPITPAPVGEPEPVWRHTFGAERRAVAVRQPLRFKPDIVLLHGVMTVASARQLFPARHYHLRVSRQVLQQPERAGAPRAATTAIAIRRDAGLRVIAQDHLLHLAEASSSVSLAAGTAVRLLGQNGSLWVLAVDLAQCPADAPDDPGCKAAVRQLDAVEDWVAERARSGEPVIVGGRFHQALDGMSLPGLLGELSRFPALDATGRDCAADDGFIESSYVLASPGSRFDRISLEGRFEPVNGAVAENDCMMLVDAEMGSTWTQTVIRAARH